MIGRTTVHFWCLMIEEKITERIKPPPERQHVYMSLSFSVCVCLCNGEIIVSFCVHVCVMTQLFSPCVCLCVSVCLHLCLCLCVHASKSLAEREYPSDTRAQPRYITAQTTTAPFWERCRGFECIFTGGCYVLYSIM